MYYEEVFTALNEKEIEYVVVGGVALVLHGVVRMTADLDLLIKMDEENIDNFIATMTELGYKPKIPVPVEDFKDPEKRRSWSEDKGMKVFSFFHSEKSMRLIDVFLEEPIDFSEVAREKKVLIAKGLSIPLVSVKHLKQLKRLSGRRQDLMDIEALEALENIKEKDVTYE